LALLIVVLALAACGPAAATPLPTPAGGVYTSSTYHFSITYPNGWQLNLAPSGSSSSAVPLSLTITRINAQAAVGAQVSTFGITVFDAHDPNAAASISALLKLIHASGSTYQPVTIAGKPGYQSKPTQEAIAGSQLTNTHTDYYLFLPDYAYHLSTDSVSGDNADSALQAMLQSFTLLK
jgi:hypothetical protein